MIGLLEVLRTRRTIGGGRPSGRLRMWRAAELGALLVALVACSSRPPPPPPPPAVDSEELATRLELGTRVEVPARIYFDWSLNEQGVRVSGRGVARIEPPYRARLDLFMGNGQTIARAALVDDDLRIPPDVPDGIIPPSHLLWSVLGVFRPGRAAAMVGAQRRLEGGLDLRYLYDNGQELQYEIDSGRVVNVELLDGGHVVQRVSVSSASDSRYPAEATYRNLGAFRELKLTRQSIEYVEPYPPDIWFPSR